MFSLPFSYVKNDEIRTGLRRLVTGVIIGLFLLVVFLALQNMQLSARLDSLEAAFAVSENSAGVSDEVALALPVYDDAAVWSKMAALEERINNLDARTTRFVVLPEGAQDLGAAMEGTIQWQGIQMRIGNNEAHLLDVSGRVGAIENSVDALNARFINGYSNLNVVDLNILEATELRAKTNLYEALQHINAGVVVVHDEFLYAPSKLVLPGARLHPNDAARIESGEVDVIPRYLAPVEGENLQFTFNGVIISLPTEPGNIVTMLESSPKVLFLSVYDNIYDENKNFWADLDTGEVFPGDPPNSAYED